MGMKTDTPSLADLIEDGSCVEHFWRVSEHITHPLFERGPGYAKIDPKILVVVCAANDDSLCNWIYCSVRIWSFSFFL